MHKRIKTKKKIFILRVAAASLLMLVAASSFAKDYLVANQVDFVKAEKKLKPGDSIILKNGVWKDFEILFRGQGTADQPITLRAEENGKVILSGQSNLRLAGQYLIVSGLVFKDGFTPTSSVIDFRRTQGDYAYHSRVTEVVIDHYNNPERTETDTWVSIYGKHNRFDHNHLEGKSNRGVTLAVRLNSEESRENYHRIDHNYFGPRSILGSNGGETLRIGTSHYSLSDSFTRVENNYFDRCDGELEIISNKSGGNTYRGNVFFESRGTLTMRHGNGTLVEDNLFFGNGADHTGGIRVINADQTIRNNYMEGLAGYRFGGALVVMNGVPNSPVNRYHQVENALIENNTLVNSDHVQLAAGSDAERSAVPIDSRIAGNLFFSQSDQDIFTLYDDVSGIEFESNLQNRTSKLGSEQGFATQPFEMHRASNGLLYPADASLAGFGVSADLKPIGKSETGTAWYPKSEPGSRFEGGSIVQVAPGEQSLSRAVSNSGPGDRLVLAAGNYIAERVLQIPHPLTIESASDNGRVHIDYERSALFEIQDGGSLYLKGLSISGMLTPDSAGNTVVRTQKSSMLGNYELIVEDSHIQDLDINHSFNFLTVSKSTFADRIKILRSSFSNITGAILKLDVENDDNGIYNAEYVDIVDSEFSDVEGALLTFYRGGTDESTFGPHFQMVGSALNNVGQGRRNRSGASIQLHGVQVATVHDNQFANSPPIVLKHTVGEPVTRIFNNDFIATAAPTVEELNSNKENTAHIYGNEFSGVVD